MKTSGVSAFFAAAVVLCAGCAEMKGPTAASLSPESLDVCNRLNLKPEQIAKLDAKPLYAFTEAELNVYLGYVQAMEPDLGKRVVRIGRKNLGQPYEIYLLGEFPYEMYDPQPLYCLSKSDCVVFSEHTYAMALSHDWPSFFATLQRIRYNGGQISVLTRNHYTEADWDRNNSWLVRDVTDEVAEGRTKPFHVTIDRAKFFKNRYKIDTSMPKEEFTSMYIPYEEMASAVKNLRNGDFVNVVYGEKELSVTHTGLIAIAGDGTVDFLHSTPPRVKEQPILQYVEQRVAANERKKASGKGGSMFVGFKFLRLEADPLANLEKIDGPGAPRVTLYIPPSNK